jgi:diguanylate cyclase (GGDEF)-like protein
MSDGDASRTLPAVPPAAPPGRRQPYLLVLAGPQLGEVFQLAPDRELLLGRHPDADLPIRDEGVSRRHATIRVEAEEVLICDRGSANGTFVDGTRAVEARLTDGARVAIGGATLLKLVWADELEARLQLRLSEGAQRDPLTGLLNRRHLEERLSAELSSALRHGRALSLLLVDVDRFKAVNDRHGHLAGDEALKLVAFVLSGALRKEDVLARLGGDEFVVLARETPLSGGRSIGERLRRAVERSRCAFEHEELALTVSVGVAATSGRGTYAPGETDRALLAAADRSLYRAKQGGGNSVE